jgi:hypothetical protein
MVATNQPSIYGLLKSFQNIRCVCCLSLCLLIAKLYFGKSALGRLLFY